MHDECRIATTLDIAVLSCSTPGLPFEESSARSSISSDSHPLSPTSSIDTATEPLHPHNHTHHPQLQSHHSAHVKQASLLSRDSSDTTSHSQRTDTATENGRSSCDDGRPSSQHGQSHANDDKGSDRGSERGSDRGGLKASGSGAEQISGGMHSRTGSRSGIQLPQLVHPSGVASSKADQVAAATAAAAAALRPSNRSNSRNPAAASSSANAAPSGGPALSKGSTGAGHAHNTTEHAHAGPGSHGTIPNGVTTKSHQQQQQSKHVSARVLNGNAAAFVPASISGAMPSISSSMSLTSAGSGALNGHAPHINHTSYRNAAAGVSTAASALNPSTSGGVPSVERGASSQGSLSPRQSVSSCLHAAEGAAPSSPPPRKVKDMQNGSVEYSGPKRSSPTPFISPDAPKVCSMCTVHTRHSMRDVCIHP